LHNYYKIATRVNLDFSLIAFLVNKTLENRLKSNLNKLGSVSKTFKKYYGKYNYKAYNVCKIRLFPVGGIKFSIPYGFAQATCSYNTLSKMAGQQGRCFVTKNDLKVGELRCMHETPTERGGTDNYNNIIIVTVDVYKLIHEENTKNQLIYIKRIGENIRNKTALNKLRKIIGNSKIMKI